MKHRIIQLITMAVVPLLGHAQVDDMYFIPKKETKDVQRQHTVPAQTQVRESAETYTLPDTYTPANGNTRDVDEYNRRHRFGETQPEDTVDTTVEEEGEWVNGFQGSDADYAYTKRILRFYTPSVGIPVSSPLYWDLCYGPNSIYWNVYDDGIYAYAFPSSWNSLYYGPYFSFSWGWRPYHSYWGWNYPWYGGWYGPWYGHHWHHHPIWGGPHYPGGTVGGNYRPVSRPSVRYRENSALARGGASRSTTGRRTLNSTSRATRESNATTRRNNTTAPVRSSSQTAPVRSRSAGSVTRSSGQPSRSTFSGGGRMPMRSGGGFSPSRSGSVSRGRR